MRLFMRFAIYFYVIVILTVGFTALLLLAHIVALKPYLDFLSFLYYDPKAGTISGFIVATTMLISYAFAVIIYGRQEQERTILINSPLGRVTIAVSALEDLVRRMVDRIPQVKEIRPEIRAIKKGIHVDVKLVLRSESNVPELAAELQKRIERKIQRVIRAEERVIIRVHVLKIIPDPVDEKGREFYDEDISDAAIPFPGYKA